MAGRSSRDSGIHRTSARPASRASSAGAKIHWHAEPTNPFHTVSVDRILEMAWREILLARFGPGLLAGLTLRDWLRLLGENRFAIARSRIPRAMSITFQSVQNSAFGVLDRLRTGRTLNDQPVPPPLF